MDFNKKEYKQYKKDAKELGVKTAYMINTNLYGYEFNGLTVAFMPMLDTQDCKMLAVSVSYCSKEDEFSKRVGKYQALRKLIWGNEFIQVPLAEFMRTYGSKRTGQHLVKCFAEI